MFPGSEHLGAIIKSSDGQGEALCLNPATCFSRAFILDSILMRYRWHTGKVKRRVCQIDKHPIKRHHLTDIEMERIMSRSQRVTLITKI